jgi:hypothetical protein
LFHAVNNYDVRLSIRRLRQIIRESIIDVSKPFDAPFLDDEKLKERSVYVPDDIKDAIRSWAKKMKLR